MSFRFVTRRKIVYRTRETREHYLSIYYLIGSLSNDVFEQRTSTGSEMFVILSCDFEQILGQIVSIRVKTLIIQIWCRQDI